MKQLTWIPVLLCFILLIQSTAMGQRKSEDRYLTYLDAMFKETKKKDAVYERHLSAINDTLLEGSVMSLEGEIKMKGTYILRATKLMEHGRFTFYYPGGGIESQGMYEYGFKIGSWQRYTAQGVERPERYYTVERTEILRALEESHESGKNLN